MLLEHVYTESTVISFEWSSSRSGVGIYINKLWKTSPDLEAFVSSICQKVDLHTVIQGVTKRPRQNSTIQPPTAAKGQTFKSSIRALSLTPNEVVQGKW